MYSYSIMNDMPGHEGDICRDIVRQYRDGVADLALFSMTLTPEGVPPIPKARMLVDRYIKYRDMLADMGEECGILAQATIGHGYRLSHPMPFTRYFGVFDKEESYTSCPLDEGFRDYIRNTMATLASAKPRLIMVDDDFRLLAKPGRGCACQLHMKKLSEILGREVTRDELKHRLVGSSEEDKRVTDAFIESQRTALVGAARAMREGIDSVDPGIQGAFCLCGIAAEFAAEIAGIIAGKGKPVIVRVNNGNYTPSGAKELSVVAERAATQIALAKAGGHIDVFLAETDTCPQNRYSTSAHNLHSHYVATILEGVSGAKHWITRLANFEPRSGEAYRRILSKYSGFYKALSELYPKLSFVGGRVPLSEKTVFNFDINTPTYSNRFSSGFACCCFERLGIPIYFSSELGSVTCLDGEMDMRFSDEEITQMLKGDMLIDGPCALRLCARGFSEYLGVSVEPWEGVIRPSQEYFDSDQRCNAPSKVYRLKPLFPNVKADSDLCYLKNGGELVSLAPGVTRYTNSLGGEITVYSGTARMPFNFVAAFSMLNQPRKEQICRIFRESGNLPVFYDGDMEIFMKTARINDGTDTVMAAIFNLGLDPSEEITLDCERVPLTVEYLDPTGVRLEASFTAKDGKVTVDLPLMTLEPQILFLIYGA